jgi:gliding motility-associated-like protein
MYSNAWYGQPGPSGLISYGDTLGGISVPGDSLRRYAVLVDTVSGCEGPALPFTIRRFDSSTVATSPDSSICLGESVPIWASGGSSYSWSPSDGLDDTASAQVTASPEQSTSYRVVITSANGCQLSDSVQIDIRSAGDCGLQVYNAFSPDGDGANELWIIDGIRAYPENRVTIFNRWGDRLQRIRDYDNDEKVWDGTRADGEALPSGTYYYVIELFGDEEQRITGYVQITK